MRRLRQTRAVAEHACPPRFEEHPRGEGGEDEDGGSEEEEEESGDGEEDEEGGEGFKEKKPRGHRHEDKEAKKVR